MDCFRTVLYERSLRCLGYNLKNTFWHRVRSFPSIFKSHFPKSCISIVMRPLNWTKNWIWPVLPVITSQLWSVNWSILGS